MQPRVWVSTLAATALLVVTNSVSGNLQEPPRLTRIAAATIDELRQWDPLVSRMARDRTLSVQASYDDPLVPGRRIEGLIQYHQGLPVYGGDVTRQVEQGVTVSIFGNIYTGIDVNSTARLTGDEARQALERLSGTSVVPQHAPALMVVPTLDGRFALAYRVSMLNAVTYFIDAHDGRVLMEVNEVQHQSAVGTGRGALGDIKKISTTLSGGVYQSRDGLRPAAVLTLDTRGSSTALGRLVQGGRWSPSDLASDADNSWTQAAVVDAHTHTGWVYDYFFKSHGYQGLNGRNAPVVGVVATRALLPNNAFYIAPPFGPDGGGGMFFGEVSSGAPFTILDVVGHELMHGVTAAAVSQRTGRRFGPAFPLETGPADIVYQGQTYPCAQTTIGGQPAFCSDGRYVLTLDHAGAINEGLSDIFGTAVEFAFQPAGAGTQRAEYTVGEDLPEIGTLVRGQAGPLRSIQDPRVLTIEGESATGVAYPDHYSRRIGFVLIVLPNGTPGLSSLALVDGVPVALNDNDSGGLHWNSTILSHAFYLAIEGGQNRSSGQSVQGVGGANRTQIEQVFFRALKDLFPSSLTFPQAGTIIRQAAVDVHGASSAATRAIDQALTAVGL